MILCHESKSLNNSFTEFKLNLSIIEHLSSTGLGSKDLQRIAHSEGQFRGGHHLDFTKATQTQWCEVRGMLLELACYLVKTSGVFQKASELKAFKNTCPPATLQHWNPYIKYCKFILTPSKTERKSWNITNKMQMTHLESELDVYTQLYTIHD